MNVVSNEVVSNECGLKWSGLKLSGLKWMWTQSSFCYRISRTPIEEAKNSLTKIISKNELNLHGICIAVIIKSNYLYNGCAWIKKGLWQPEEDFFFVGFFFSSSSGTLGSMTIKRHGHLCQTRVTSGCQNIGCFCCIENLNWAAQNLQLSQMRPAGWT